MAAKSIDDYLSRVQPEQRRALERLRKQIKAAAPGVEECISYGLPAFRKGRVVCGFGATTKHCALYMFCGDALGPFADALQGYDTSKGTIRFQPDRPLPAALVRELVQARVRDSGAHRGRA